MEARICDVCNELIKERQKFRVILLDAELQPSMNGARSVADLEVCKKCLFDDSEIGDLQGKLEVAARDYLTNKKEK